jgi:hypothetical protein
MSRITFRDVLTLVIFVAIILSGTAAGYFRWFRTRGIEGTVRETVESAIDRQEEPAKEPAESAK